MAELKLWGSGYRTNKVKLVAAFAGVNVEQQLTFTHGTTNKTPQFLAMSELGKVRMLSPYAHTSVSWQQQCIMREPPASAEPSDLQHVVLESKGATVQVNGHQI